MLRCEMENSTLGGLESGILVLTGETCGGQPIDGEDCIILVSPESFNPCEYWFSGGLRAPFLLTGALERVPGYGRERTNLIFRRTLSCFGDISESPP